MATYVAINREDLDTVSLIEADSEKDADQILMEHLGWDGDTFEDFFSGYTGEFKWRVEAKGPGDIAVTYVGYGHRMRGTDRLVLKEIYAESIWGRSHEGLGKIHVVAIDDLTPVGLTPEVL